MVEPSLAHDSLDVAKVQTSSKPRSDGGTIVLHWLTVLSMVASLLTGLRISADGQSTVWATTWAKTLGPILPQGEIWTWHMAASLTLAFCIVGYFIYVYRARLGDRNSAARLRTFTPPTTSRLRWRAVNVALHWLAYFCVFALTVSGTILYLGYGDIFVTVHRALAWTMLIYILVHSCTHFMYGGIGQLLRLFRPQPLVNSGRLKPWPVSMALGSAAVVAAGVYALDATTKPTLFVSYQDQSPVLDGALDEAFWADAPSVTIATQQGANLGGTGSSNVEIRAFRTAQHIHFAFRWEDPTRSLVRAPTIKREDGWYVMGSGNKQADVNDYYEDKFSLLFSHNDAFGGGGATFLGKNPLKAYPKSPHGRGLHYTDDGRVLDMWQWKATRGGMLGYVDDMHFGPPKKPSKKQLEGRKRYAAGYAADPGQAIYEYNYIADGPLGYDSPVRLKRLPISLRTATAALGQIPDDADGSNSPDSQWWMTAANSAPYDPAKDAQFPVGTILPSTLNIHTYHGDRADLKGSARWKDGVWTLEVSRKLHTGSAYDIDFQPGTRLYLWASVFDHNQTRHTRHQRPVQIDIE